MAAVEGRIAVSWSHGEEDDRYLYRMRDGAFDLASKTLCPDLTGSAYDHSKLDHLPRTDAFLSTLRCADFHARTALLFTRIRRFRWWTGGGSNPRPLTCEVILGQKTLPRKRPAKGAKPHSHRGLSAFRISRCFREFPRFSARMVVKWSSKPARPSTV